MASLAMRYPPYASDTAYPSVGAHRHSPYTGPRSSAAAPAAAALACRALPYRDRTASPAPGGDSYRVLITLIILSLLN